MNNLLKIDHFNCAKTLGKEALKLKKYKAMHPILAIFVGIFMIPFIIFSLAWMGSYLVIAYLRNLCVSPIRALHGLVNNEGKETRHATQAIIYFISWPTIFFLYFFEAVMLPILTICYTCTSICTYICTLGGFNFHIFPEKASESDIGEVKGRYLVLPIVYISVCAAFIVVMLVHLAIDYANWQSWANYASKYIQLAYSFQYAYIYGVIYSLFTVVYSFIGFAKNPKEKKN